MENQEIDFEKYGNEKLKKLESAKEMVLSTSSNNGKVTSRVISVSCVNDKILFMSLGTNTKAIQMLENPSVSLCYQNLTIEGKARMLGDALDEAYMDTINQYKRHQAENYKTFSIQPGMKLFEIQITGISECSANGECFAEWVDYTNQKAYRT
jgi:pyridoxine/pyridoxamine 5'-phosphate oxidase